MEPNPNFSLKNKHKPKHDPYMVFRRQTTAVAAVQPRDPKLRTLTLTLTLTLNLTLTPSQASDVSNLTTTLGIDPSTALNGNICTSYFCHEAITL